MKRFLFTLLAALLVSGCGSSGDTFELNTDPVFGTLPPANQPATTRGFRVVNTFPHQTDAFTQGLLFDTNDGFLYESTGLTGQSELRRVTLTSGQVVQRKSLGAQFFGEGLALRGGLLYQLTLNAGIGFIQEQRSFDEVGTFPYTGQGWGITTGVDSFILSDGTDTLRFLDFGNFQVVRTVQVTDQGVAIRGLNELEFVNGVLLANIFQTDRIAAIDPGTGRVLFYVDLTGIIDKQANNLGADDVLNGIAFDARLSRLFVTGKRWPNLYQIEITQ